MPTLMDSNILLRFTHQDSPDYALTFEAVNTLQEEGETLCYTSQNLGEFWNVWPPACYSARRLWFEHPRNGAARSRY